MQQRTKIISDFLADAISNQSWYRAHANTVNGVLASIAGVVVWLSTYLGATGAMPELNEILVSFVVPLFTGLALAVTKNGIGPQQSNELLKHAREAEERDIEAALLDAERHDVVNGFSVYDA